MDLDGDCGRGRGRSSLGSAFSWCGRAHVLSRVEFVCVLRDHRRRQKPIFLPISCLIFVSMSSSLSLAQVPLL